MTSRYGNPTSGGPPAPGPSFGVTRPTQIKVAGQGVRPGVQYVARQAVLPSPFSQGGGDGVPPPDRTIRRINYAAEIGVVLPKRSKPPAARASPVPAEVARPKVVHEGDTLKKAYMRGYQAGLRAGKKNP